MRAAVVAAALLALLACRSAPAPIGKTETVPSAAVAPSCATDADCVASPWNRPVETEADCYCLTCPAPMSVSESDRNEAAWKSNCEGLWLEKSDCRPPACARPPGKPGCQGGVCGWVPSPAAL